MCYYKIKRNIINKQMGKFDMVGRLSFEREERKRLQKEK